MVAHIYVDETHIIGKYANMQIGKRQKMPESRPEDALGTLVKLVQTVCTKYLTLLHCEISD